MAIRGQERMEEVRRLHALGWSDQAMAKHLQVSDSTVSKDRRVLGLPANVTPGKPKVEVPPFEEEKSPGLSDEALGRLITLAKAGFSLMELANAFAVSEDEVRKELRGVFDRIARPMPADLEGVAG